MQALQGMKKKLEEQGGGGDSKPQNPFVRRDSKFSFGSLIMLKSAKRRAKAQKGYRTLT